MLGRSLTRCRPTCRPGSDHTDIVFLPLDLVERRRKVVFVCGTVREVSKGGARRCSLAYKQPYWPPRGHRQPRLQTSQRVELIQANCRAV